MEVRVNVAGGGDELFEVPDGGTYGDLLEAAGLTRHEATVIVDGNPVPADAPVEESSVRILKLVAGG